MDLISLLLLLFLFWDAVQNRVNSAKARKSSISARVKNKHRKLSLTPSTAFEEGGNDAPATGYGAPTELEMQQIDDVGGPDEDHDEAVNV